MALFHPDDPSYDESIRQTGFNRYKQLLSFHAGEWLKLNLLMCLGMLPFVVGVTYSILASSSLVLIPCSLVGGAIFGPFLAGMIDSIQRGLRDDTNNWWHNYKKSWKQNWKISVISGAIFGLLFAMLIFMVYMLWISSNFGGWGNIALMLFSLVMLIIINTLYWPQIVLFNISPMTCIRNIVLFTSKYLWKMLGVTAFQIAWIGIFFLFAPVSLIVFPFLGFWFALFLSQFWIYDALNEELHIEELFDTTTD